MIYNYGYMVLPKDTILYHMNDKKKFTYQNIEDKSFLFCTFHPSEYIGSKYIHYIKLKKKIKLLFMIDDIGRNRIYSSLPNIINHPRLNLSKLNNNVLKEMKNILENQHLKGWFTSIENKTAVEVAILNKTNIFEYIGSHRFETEWKNGNYNGNIIIQKNWGNYYPISFIKNPIKLYVNKRFKKIFQNYKKYEKKSKFIHEYIFQIMLDYAIIKYYK